MNKVTRSVNPVTGEILGEFRVADEDEVLRIIENAKIAQKKWAKVSIKERVRKIKKVRDFIVENIDDIANAISRENGKVRIDALATEVLPAAIAVNYYCKNAEKFLKDEKLKSGNLLLFNKKSKIHKIPYGVIAIISPWNYPFSIPFSEVIMALLAGNSVVLKTATQSQLIGHKLKEAIEFADLPEYVFNYVNISGRVAGHLFVKAGVDKIFFTGSVSTGKYLMKIASERLIPVCLELGGNDPMIVFDDANLDRAAWGAIWAGFQNSGQSCGGVERIYVQETIYDVFLEKLKEKLDSIKIGYDEDFNADIGSMTTSSQVETVREHIEDSLKKGASIYYQKEIESKNIKNINMFVPPTIIVDVNHNMKLMQDETFGPVVGVMKFKTIDEAIELANDSYLGLTASIWTKNKKLAKKLAKEIQAGVIMINDHLMSHGLAETPWGGFKQSGIGRTHGKIGFDEMVQKQVVVDDILDFTKKDMWWHPYNKDLYEGLKSVIYFLYSKKYWY